MAPAASAGVGAAGGERERVEEGRDQAHLVIGISRIADDVEVRVEAVDRLGQHRVAEAIDRVRELGDDRRVDRGVVAVRREERVDLRLDGARELLEHEMLVLHLGAELRRLEQALAVPLQRVDLRLGGGERDASAVPGSSHWLRKAGRRLCQQMTCLGLVDEPVVLGVEDRVDGGEADVLVDAAVAGDVVRVEQFVVVGAGWRRVRCRRRVGVGRAGRRSGIGSLCAMSIRNWWPVRTALARSIGAGRIAFDEDVVRGVGNDRPRPSSIDHAGSRCAPLMKLP